MNIRDLRIKQELRLVSPVELEDSLPVSSQVLKTVIENRETVNRIILGQDSRLLAIVGPCSIHDPASAYDYALKLKKLSEEVSDCLFVVMRTYFEKPRTSLGWKGLITDPDMDDFCDIEKGLKLARKILIEINETGLPVGGEILDPLVPQYIDDLPSWVSIGARTTESQIHRSLASGLSVAVGFKNNTSGDFEGAVNSIKAANKPASFMGINREGFPAVVRTSGNECAHLILRGGEQAPNYFEDDIQRASVKLRENGLLNTILVDCSHGNSRRDPLRQEDVLSSILDQVIWGQKAIKGFMFESFLEYGRQEPNRQHLEYGLSVTDSCLGWDSTKRILTEAAERLRKNK